VTAGRDGIHLSLERLVALGRLAASEQRGGYAQSHSGSTTGRQRGQGADVYDLRPFQDGDDPRKLDPAATARSGRAQVRTFHEDVDRTLLLVADLRGPMFWGTHGRLRSVAAAEALALEGWRTIAAGGRVGLHAATDGTHATLAPRPREASMLDIAAALVRLHAIGVETPSRSDPGDLSTLLDQAIARVMPGTEVVLATGYDQPGADFASVAEAALRKCRLRILLVQDRIEAEPPRGVFPVRASGRIRQVRFAAATTLQHLQEIGIPAQTLRSADDLLAMAMPA
jgi:uncharacterized protein (DUF58 family)